MASPILNNEGCSNLLDSITTSTPFPKEKGRGKTEKNIIVEHHLIELEKENMFLADKLKTFDLSRAKLAILQRENTKLRKKIEKFKVQISKIEKDYMLDIELLQQTAEKAAQRERDFEVQLKDWQKSKYEYESKITDMSVDAVSSERYIKTLSEDLEKLRCAVKSDLIDGNELNQLQNKWRESTESALEAIRRDIAENYVPVLQYDVLKEELRRCSLAKSVAEESQISLYQENSSLKEQNERLNSAQSELQTELKRSNSELHALREKFSRYQDEIAGASVAITGIMNISASTMTDATGKLMDRDNFPSRHHDVSSILLETQLGKFKVQLREDKRKIIELSSQLAESMKEKADLEQISEERIQNLSSEVKMLNQEADERDKELLEWKSNSFELEKKVLALEDTIKKRNDNGKKTDQAKLIKHSMYEVEIGKTSKLVSGEGLTIHDLTTKRKYESEKIFYKPGKVNDIYRSADFDALKLNVGKLSVVYFSANKFQPCKEIRDKFSFLARQMTEAVFFVVDNEAQPDGETICRNEGISSMPTFTMYYGGENVFHFEGFNEILLRKKIAEFLCRLKKLEAGKSNLKSTRWKG